MARFAFFVLLVTSCTTGLLASEEPLADSSAVDPEGDGSAQIGVPLADKPGTDPGDKVRLPLVEPTVVVPKQPGQTLAPGALTPRQKAKLFLWKSVGPSAIANRLILAGYNQWSDHPEEWGQGMEGYGKRVANRFARMTIRNGIMLGANVAFKTDPRYDQCECAGFWARTGHAARRVVVARTDYGGETVNVARLAGAYVTPWITYQWYPDRLNTTDRKLLVGTSYLGWRVASNVLAEFWPDIKRKLRRK